MTGDVPLDIPPQFVCTEAASLPDIKKKKKKKKQKKKKKKKKKRKKKSQLTIVLLAVAE